MKRLRIAVVGVGRLGTFHAQKLARNPRVQLVAVVDPIAQRRLKLAQELACEPLPTHESLAGRIDAVIIATPTIHHYELGMYFLRRSVHVFMEKPLAVTLEQAEELAEQAARSGVVLQVGHIERYNPAFLAALPHVPQAKFIRAVRTSGFTFRSTDIGVVLDMMIHDLDLALFLARSPVRRVDAVGISVLGGHEDVADARLEFENGCVAHLSAARVSRQVQRRIDIWSPRGMASIDLANCSLEVIHPSMLLVERKFHLEDLSEEEVEYYKQHLLDEHLPLERLEVEKTDALEQEQADFIDSIQQGRTPWVTAEDGCRAIAAAEAILAEIRTHAWEGDQRGPVGPLATPKPAFAGGPHWNQVPETIPIRYRKAS